MIDDPRLPILEARIASDPLFAQRVRVVEIADQLAEILAGPNGIERLAELQQTTTEDIAHRLGFSIALLSHAVALFLVEEAVRDAEIAKPGEVDDFLKGLFEGGK